MKKILLLLAVFIVSLNCYCQEIQKIDIDLQEEMQLRSADELIKINIIMKDQYDQFELRSKTALYRTKEDKRSFVVNELKRFAVETQQEVMSYLEFFATNDAVSNITQFWIYNGITCYATQEVITQLSFLDDVIAIGFDKEQNWLFENEKQKATDEESKALTWNVTKVNADLVWDLGFEGEGIIVAIVDTGVNYNHNDLKTHLWEHPDGHHGWNYVSNNSNPMDDHGHGTHCAGTVAGDGTSGTQTGMAPKALIMALKVWNSQGSGTSSQMCSGIQFAVDNGAHVVSMSGGVWGGGNTSEKIQFRNTMINVLEAGVVASIASGNEHTGWDYSPIPNQVRVPGNCPPPWLHPDQTTTGGTTAVVCVGATNNNDNIANFSSCGPVTWQSITGFNDYPYNPGMGLIRPDVCAPGVNITSLAHYSNTGYEYGWDGTSMATPCVSGVMALLLSKNPDLTPAEICEILETTAVHLPNATSPKGNTYGSGRIDALAAVETVSGCGGAISDLACTLIYDKTVNLTWNRPANDTNLAGYHIYVNEVLLEGMFTEESLTFHATEEGDYKFCVVAVYQTDDEYCESSVVCENISVTSICDAISDLNASVDEYTVNLSWVAPELISEVLHYNIYRDDEFVDAVETVTFSEETTAGVHTYAIEVEYLNECISDTVSIDVRILAAPANLTATAQPEDVSIELSWEYDDTTATFILFRDDIILVENIETTQYIDNEISTCIHYCYYVKAVVDELVSAASNEDCAGIVGIIEYSSHLKVYPNPATGVLNLIQETINNEQFAINNIEIIDVFGRIVSAHLLITSSSHHQIDISHLPAGNYVVSVSYSDGSTENVKVVIK